MRRVRQVLAGVLVLMLAMAGCAAPGGAPDGGAPASPSAAPAVLPDAQVAPLVAGVTTRTPKGLDARRLADGLTPPTNRWYSGLVFGEQPQPVFPLPLSFALTADGFALGLPRVAATADTISGGFVADVPVGLGAASEVVATDDPSVVGIDSLAADGTRLGRTTIAQGSPFVSFVASTATTVTIPEGFAASGQVWVATIGGTRYALRADRAEVAGSSIRIEAGGSLVFWPVPADRDPAELAPYAHALTGSTLRYRVDDASVSTTLSYAGGDTAIARLPHQAGGDCTLGEYPSVYGAMRLCAGNELSWTTPRTQARAALDLGGISAAERDELTRDLAADAAGLPDFPADTYFGGKALQRTAMLLMVADQLGASTQADQLASVLDGQLSRWTEPGGCGSRAASCFVYDPAGRGMIGLAASFGSDEYNDHHFHYGYFLYAAAVLAAHDPSVVPRYAPVLILLAADIGSAGNSAFPDRRAFDAYASHSWASGTAPFADGNNQESVSEAVNAYAGLALWARATGDTALAAEADWMLSLEAHDSAAYWLQPDLSAFGEYTHRIVSLNWGAKRDYATWFSDAPAAKLGILLLPMSPTSTYLGGEPDAIRANVAEAVGKRFGQKFGDYVLMYAGLAGTADRDAAIRVARAFPARDLDDGMSRTYLLAWLYALG